LPRDFSVPLLCPNIFPSYLPPLVYFYGVLAKKKNATSTTIVIFVCGGVAKEKKVMATATVAFFDDGVAKKKKAMASSIVTFFCGDVDF
jgi:hypothetical protein